MSRFQKIIVALLAALVVVVGVGVVIVVQQQSAAAAQADYERCMAIYGFTPDQPNGDLDGMLDASERCSS